MIATIYPEGIRRVAEMDLPKVEGVSYVVAWQMPGAEPIPETLARRDDVTIVRSDTRGVARNRNIALRAASADIVMLSDDDLRYTRESLRKVIDTFKANPDVDVALFRYEGGNKVYPDREAELHLPLPMKGWYVTEFELAFRRDAVQGKAEFDEAFGIGAGYIGAGEVDILLVRLLRGLGLRGRFFPETIARHPAHPTTGERPGQKLCVVRSRGVFRRLYYPWSWPLRILLDAGRDHRSGRASFPRSLLGLTQGAVYAIRNLRPDGSRK